MADENSERSISVRYATPAVVRGAVAVAVAALTLRSSTLDARRGCSVGSGMASISSGSTFLLRGAEVLRDGCAPCAVVVSCCEIRLDASEGQASGQRAVGCSGVAFGGHRRHIDRSLTFLNLRGGGI